METEFTKTEDQQALEWVVPVEMLSHILRFSYVSDYCSLSLVHSTLNCEMHPKLQSLKLELQSLKLLHTCLLSELIEKVPPKNYCHYKYNFSRRHFVLNGRRCRKSISGIGSFCSKHRRARRRNFDISQIRHFQLSYLT